ncbi:MAG: hypothetical protein ACJAVR_002015 [Paracoccaceae bacterium]|jgi:hypothetical protein
MSAVVKLNERRSHSMRGPSLNPDVLAALGFAVGPEMCREIIEDALLMVTERLISVDYALRRSDLNKVGRLAEDICAVAGRIGMGAVATQAAALRDCARRADDIAAQAVGSRLLRTGEASLMAHHGDLTG